MAIDLLAAGDAARKIHELEQLLELPIGALIVLTSAGRLAFVMPGEADEAYGRWLLGWVAEAATRTAKSL